jgi:adenine/guanine phosphoribosyltransferase-like PRPP-binding protein
MPRTWNYVPAKAMWPKIDPKALQYDYIQSIFNIEELSGVVHRVSQMLRLIYLDTPFESIAVSGTSGLLLLAGAISHKLGIPLNIVRKEGETNHHDKDVCVRGYANTENYVILDDAIVSGKTMGHILSKMTGAFPASRCVGIILWVEEYNSSYTNFDYKRSKINVYQVGGGYAKRIR